MRVMGVDLTLARTCSSAPLPELPHLEINFAFELAEEA